MGNTSGGKVEKKRDAALKGWGGLQDVEVVERMEENSLEAQMSKFAPSPDAKSNFFPVLRKLGRPMAGVDGSQSRIGIASDLIQGTR